MQHARRCGSRAAGAGLRRSRARSTSRSAEPARTRSPGSRRGRGSTGSAGKPPSSPAGSARSTAPRSWSDEREAMSVDEPLERPPSPERRPSIVSSAVFTYATNVAVAVLSLANVLIMSRALGPHARGEVAFLITVSTITGLVAGLSLQEANANIGGSEASKRPGLATNSVVLAILCGAGATLVITLIATAVPAVGGPVSREAFVIALAASSITMLKTSFSYLLQSEYAFTITNAAWLIGPLTGATVNGTLAFTGKLNVSLAFGVWIAGQLLGVAIMSVYIARHSGFGRPALHLARRALSFA